ncbi:type I-E CRISPR-associated protein Cse2/CasB [Nocardioides sp. NPDC101246]|uniref:type I-E CRISPR-associated protein Cse2/CasB n=1 Tax=Nocardioides sp. NPDC101246 TaxID=3364336 RepID=UPI00381A239B
MTAIPPAEPVEATNRTTTELLTEYVGRRVTGLQSAYQNDSPAAVATLARFRRVTPTSGSLGLDAWEAFGGMPEQIMGRGDAIGRAELAAIAALSFFATHQQSRRDAGMHQPGHRFALGRSIARLAYVTRSAGVERRFRALVRANDIDATLQYLRGLIPQLRGERIPLDYAGLAKDLYLIQLPDGLPGVRLRWTRDFHRPIGDQADTPTETGDQQ